jgi:hypothetical protein
LSATSVPRGCAPPVPSLSSVKPHEAIADWPSHTNSLRVTAACRLYPLIETQFESSRVK